MTEQRRVKAHMKSYRYATMLDLKAGYLNVPFEEESSYLSTFITHRGKYRWRRMCFGLTQEPAHFQSVVEDIVTCGGKEKLPCSIYIDDITLFGDDLDELLENSRLVIERLTVAGFMMNLRKSKFGVTEGVILGHQWQSGGYFTPVGTKLEELMGKSDS